MIFPPCPKHLRQLASSLACSAALALAACGGGGGGEPAALAPPATSVPPVTPDPATSLPPSTALLPSASLANMCSVPGQQRFIRSYLDEVYLWYDEIPSVNAGDFTSVPAYFRALLVRTPDANGRPKDQFSAVLTTAGADALQSRALTDAADPALLGAAGDSVPLSKVVNSVGGRKVGYVLFNDHDAQAPDALIAAFEGLRTAAVTDLVLDMRYNSGGFLYVAQTAASLVTSPQASGKVFEQLRYNNKRQAESAASALLFSSQLQVGGTRYPRGSTLPQLSLPRLYVLSSSLTCSASESVINSLRGIDIEVVVIGDTTCGKPYGFRRKDNCGLAFFPIEFQGYNARGVGDYTGGIPPTCRVAENLSSALGSTDEPLLAAALRHVDTGSCPPAPARAEGLLSQNLLNADRGTERANAPKTARSLWDGRLLQSSGQ